MPASIERAGPQLENVVAGQADAVVRLVPGRAVIVADLKSKYSK